MSTQRATPSQGGAYYYVVAGGLALAGGHSVIVVTAPRQSRRVSPREGRGGHRIAGVIGLCRVIPVLFVQKCPIVRRNQYTSILNFVFLPSTLFARALPIGSPHPSNLLIHNSNNAPIVKALPPQRSHSDHLIQLEPHQHVY